MKIKPIIFGVSGKVLLQEERELFLEHEVEGFIIFARNVESKDQLIQLTSDLKAIYPDRDVPIFTDQEGGRVLRIKEPLAQKNYPTAEYFANIYDEDKEQAKSEVHNNYKDLMTELKSFGLDSPCAPVCDIRYEGASDVIGDRAFGYETDKVIDLCKSAIHAILDSGGLPFIKHIPGHGRSKVDSHQALPIVTNSLEELENTDFKVFKELSDEFGENVWGMTAHIIYTALDEKSSATTSPVVIDYIKNDIGFTGKLVSDDIGMGALHGEDGEKYALIHRALRFIECNRDLTRLSEHLKDFFDLDMSELNKDEILERCEELSKENKPAFLSSLSSVTIDVLNAGCDYVLHCSGDLEEMQTVCAATDDYYLINIRDLKMTYCDYSNQEKYPFTLPELPFKKDAFAPHFTAETFDYHHGKHHNAYVTNLNKLIDNNKEFADTDLEMLIKTTASTNAAIFNNAAQIWNHTFFWHSIKPNAGGKPTGEMLEQIEKDFGSYKDFAAEFKQAALTQFGSGWAWLVYHGDKLKIVKTANAETTLTQGMDPLIACDVWEHAYYIDYRNKRPDYVSTFLESMLNWDFAEMHLNRARQ